MTALNTTPLDFVDRIRGLRSENRQSVSAIMKEVRAGYFGTSTDTELDVAMDDMFDDVIETLDAASASNKEANHIGRMSEGFPLLGLGASGTRKTSTFARMIHKRPEFAGFSYVPHLNTSPLISVKAPSPCTLRVLGITIAKAMGLPCSDTMVENEVWNLIIENVADRNVRFVHIDEFQHVMENRNVVDIAKIRNAMKRLVQTPQHPVWLLITGMPEVGVMAEGDTQLWRRKTYMLFDELDFNRDAEMCVGMIQFFATKKAGLGCDDFNIPENVHRLMHASLFRLGVAIDVVVRAIRVALKAGSKELKVEHLAQAYQIFTGCHGASNPFLAPGDFTTIEVDKHVTRLMEHANSKAGAKVKGATK